MIFWSILCVWVAIDIGSAFTKAAIVSNEETIEFAKDPLGKDVTPTFIGWRAKPGYDWNATDILSIDEAHFLSPEIGDRALKISETKPSMAGSFMPDLFELSQNAVNDRAKQLHTYVNPGRVKLNDGLTLFCKLYLDSVLDNQSVNALTFVVPACFTYQQRNQLAYLGRHLGYGRVGVIDELDAIAYVYSNDRASKFAHAPSTILFIDVGATSVKAFVMRFSTEVTPTGRSTFPSVQRLTYEFDYETGGYFLTLRIAEWITKKLNLGNLTEPEEMRVIHAAERLKLAVAADNEASVVIPEIKSLDRNIVMNVDELKELMEPFIDDVVRVAKRASAGHKIDFVEVYGGVSNFKPMVEGIKTRLGLSVIGRNLKSQHVLVKGGAYFHQFDHSVSRYQEVKIRQPVALANLSLMTLDDDDVVCAKGQKCPENWVLNGSGRFFVISLANEHCRTGIKHTGQGFLFDEVPGQIRVHFTAYPYQVNLVEKFNNSEWTPISVRETMNPEPPTDVLNFYLRAETRERQKQKLKDRLLTLAQKVLDDVQKDHSFRFFSSHDQRLDIIRTAQAAKNWVEINGTNCTALGEFTSRIHAVDACSKPVYDRVQRNTTFILTIKLIYTTILAGNNTIKEWNETKSFVDNRTFERFCEIVNETDHWMLWAINYTRSSPPWMELRIQPEEVENKALRLYEALKVVSGMKRPKKKTGVQIPLESDPDVMVDEEVDMTDEEAAALNAQQPWTDPFSKIDEEIASIVDNDQLRKLKRHYHQQFLLDYFKKMKPLKEMDHKENEQEPDVTSEL